MEIEEIIKHFDFEQQQELWKEIQILNEKTLAVFFNRIKKLIHEAKMEKIKYLFFLLKKYLLIIKIDEESKLVLNTYVNQIVLALHNISLELAAIEKIEHQLKQTSNYEQILLLYRKLLICYLMHLKRNSYLVFCQEKFKYGLNGIDYDNGLYNNDYSEEQKLLIHEIN